MKTEITEDSSLSDMSVGEHAKKKKISMIEISNYLSSKRSQRKSKLRRTTNRTSASSGKESRKSKRAFSYKCALDESAIGAVLENPELEATISLSCPSENVGVRSMSLDNTEVEYLGEFEAFAFAEILQEAIEALDLLKHTVRDDADANERHERIMTRKLGSCMPEHERKLIFGRDAGYGPVVKSVSEKLLADRNLVCKVFQKIACELREHGTYEGLRCEVDAIIEAKEKEKHLEINRKIWIDLIQKLQESQSRLQEEFDRVQKEYNEDADKLAAEIDTAYCDNRDKLDYIRRWEEAKVEQHNYRLSLHEESLLNEIKELELERSRDAKVSEELQSYGKSAIYSTENEINEWTERYHEELDRRTREINQLQESIEKLQESMEKQREIQRERQVVIDEYMAEQKRINDEIEYLKSVNEQATIIQSFWRGYMVRHRLGKYDAIFKEAAKNKDKKKTKKKKKKGKKK